MKDKGLLAENVVSSSVNFFRHENKNQFKLLKDLISTKALEIVLKFSN